MSGVSTGRLAVAGLTLLAPFLVLCRHHMLLSMTLQLLADNPAQHSRYSSMRQCCSAMLFPC